MITIAEGAVWFALGLLAGLILSDPKKYFD